jgi:hypothetical protein
MTHLSWTDIESGIDFAVVKQQNAENDITRRQVQYFRAVLALCEAHTGLLPDRISTGCDPSLVAYYFGDAKVQTRIEVYDDIEVGFGLEILIAWSIPNMYPHVEDLTLAQAADGERFKEMSKILYQKYSNE